MSRSATPAEATRLRAAGLRENYASDSPRSRWFWPTGGGADLTTEEALDMLAERDKPSAVEHERERRSCIADAISNAASRHSKTPDPEAARFVSRAADLASFEFDRRFRAPGDSAVKVARIEALLAKWEREASTPAALGLSALQTDAIGWDAPLVIAELRAALEGPK